MKSKYAINYTECGYLMKNTSPCPGSKTVPACKCCGFSPLTWDGLLGYFIGDGRCILPGLYEAKSQI